MGYQLVNVANGFTFFTVTFKNVGKESIDLLQILCKQADGSDWLATGRTASKKCNGEIIAQKMKGTSGNFDTPVAYYSTYIEGTETVLGWSKDGKTPIIKGEVVLGPGEGLIVQNGKTDNVEGAFLVSGEVALGTQYDVANGFSFSGNCTPVKIDLLQVLCKQADGTDWLATGRTASKKCNGEIIVQKMKGTSGNFDTPIAYYSTYIEGTETVLGWSKDGKTPIVEGEVTLEPGEGIIVQNGKTDNVTGLFVFPNPMK